MTPDYPGLIGTVPIYDLRKRVAYEAVNTVLNEIFFLLNFFSPQIFKDKVAYDLKSAYMVYNALNPALRFNIAVLLLNGIADICSMFYNLNDTS